MNQRVFGGGESSMELSSGIAEDGQRHYEYSLVSLGSGVMLVAADGADAFVPHARSVDLHRIQLQGSVARKVTRRARPPSVRRRLAVQRARRYINEHFSEAIRLSDLCRNAHAQARSLEYAFREVLGVSPIAYLRVIRLNRAREILHTAAVWTQSISQIALDSGFSHLSQFAVDYKRHFGESPSVTYQRTRSEATGETWRNTSNVRKPRRADARVTAAIAVPG
jgi:AraC-like DNA-binding protein